MKSLEAYKHMASYYRALVNEREHFQSQAAIVKELIKLINKPHPRILDAACGSGDVLALLASDYRHIAGVDGSPDMLSIAITDPRLEGISFSCCRWENLKFFFMRQEQFDLVFFLGNSIAHIEDRKSLKDIVSIVYNGLSSGGILAFDIRNWILDKESGKLIEQGRSISSPRNLGSFKNTEGKAFEITDQCSYSNGRQNIKYNIQGVNFSDDFTLSYLPFSCDDALDIIKQSGFDNYKTQVYPNWKYTVIIGFKS